MSKTVKYAGVSKSCLAGNDATFSFHSTNVDGKMGVWLTMPSDDTAMMTSYFFQKMPSDTTKAQAVVILRDAFKEHTDIVAFLDTLVAKSAPKEPKVRAPRKSKLEKSVTVIVEKTLTDAEAKAKKEAGVAKIREAVEAAKAKRAAAAA